MDAFESRISTLLHDTVPEPDREVSPSAVVRQGRRRRQVALAVPAIAAVVIAAVVAASLVIAGRSSDKPVQPAHTRAVPLGKLTLYVPQTWGQQQAYVFPNSIHGVSTQVGPAISYGNTSVRVACQPRQSNGIAPCTVAYQPWRKDVVLVDAGVVHYRDRSRVDPLLDTKVAGRPAQVYDEVNTDIQCPPRTASSVQVVVDVGGGNYAGILGCLGPSDAARAAFQKLLDSARFTG